MSLQQKVRECWLLRKGSSVDSDENEEELYAAGNMVIWSRGSKSHASHVYKAFTVGSPVVQIPRLLAELREVGVYSIAFEFSEGSPLSGPSFSASSSRRSLGPGPVPEGAVFPPPRARQSRERRKRILLVCEQDVMEQTVCIVPRSCVNGHSVTPKDLISPLHFQEPLPTAFSMLHPLDESGVQTYRSVRGCLCAIRL
ncbi:anaphase-promoting complex subunit 1-like isoform 1-T1 [Salvelinus alpinus]|uniref:anaphase-promoting complex subunit 1 isoform X1 n=1 Tax=Salvelinus alpinus TaxID=8036 RepID=UPI0039FD6B30